MSTTSTNSKDIFGDPEAIHKYAFRFTDGEKYRFINMATGKAISSISIDSTPLQFVTKAIAEDRALPGEPKEQLQLWRLVQSKSHHNDTIENPSGESTLTLTYAIESLLHKARNGSGHPFRIDVAKKVTNPNAITHANPAFYDTEMLDGAVDMRDAPEVSSESAQTRLETRHDIVLSARAGRTSKWIFLTTGKIGNYLIFNPETNSCLVQKNEKLLAIDVRQVCGALHDRTSNNPEAGLHPFLDDDSEQEWRQSIWKIQLWDNGPEAGRYRIVSAVGALALEPKIMRPYQSRSSRETGSIDLVLRPVRGVPLRVAPINPLLVTQDWEITAQDQDGNITYKLNNGINEHSHFSGSSFRFIKIQDCSGRKNDLFVIYDPQKRTLLGTREYPGTGEYNVTLYSVVQYDGETEESILARIYHLRYSPLRNEILWRLDPVVFQPKDGVYRISRSDKKYLSIPTSSWSDPTDIYLLPSESDNGTPETQWWFLTSKVCPKGYTYREIRNYRTGQVLNLNGNGAFMDVVKAQRLGTPTNFAWRVISSDSKDINQCAIESVDQEKCFLCGHGMVGISPKQSSSAPLSGALLWKFEEIDMVLTPGKAYHIVHLASNTLLSHNPSNLSVSTEESSEENTKWEVARGRGSGYIFYFTDSSANEDSVEWQLSLSESLSAETNEVFVLPTLKRYTGAATDNSSWYIVSMGSEHEGYSLNGSKGSLLVEKEMGRTSVVISKPCTMVSRLPKTFGWRFVEVEHWTCPAPVTIAKSVVGEHHLPDGIYRMMNHQSKCVISVNPQDVTNRCEKASEYPIATTLTPSGSEYDFHQLWYIQRDKISEPNCKITEPNLYTIRSCATSLYLDVGNATARQRYDGVQPYVTPVQEVYTTQQWRITKQSAEGWTIESRVVGSVLDNSNPTTPPLRRAELPEVGYGDILVTKPRTLNQTLQSQMWVIEPVRCSLSSGAYYIVSKLTGNDIYVGNRPSASKVNGAFTIVVGRREAFAATDIQWRITGQPDGHYHIESLQHLQFLTAIDEHGSINFTNSVEGMRSSWQIWPLPDGTVRFQNATTRRFIRLNDEHMDGAAVENVNEFIGLRSSSAVFSLKRINPLSRSYDTFPTDNIIPGLFRVKNVGTQGFLSFGTSPTELHTTMPTRRANILWNIKASGTGYYAFENGQGYSLGHEWPGVRGEVGPVSILPGYFDVTRWKLVKLGSSFFRIVNKDSGLLLTAMESSGFTNEVTARADMGSVSLQQWVLIPEDKKVPAEKVDEEFTRLNREIHFSNGSYTLKNCRAKRTLIFTPDRRIQVEQHALSGLSPSINHETLIITKTREGWYNLRSFAYGSFLGVDPGGYLQLKHDVESNECGFHWKFIQGVEEANISLVNRLLLSSSLGVNKDGSVSLLPWSRDQEQRWKIASRPVYSSSPVKRKIPTGVYSISTYQNSNPTAAQETSQLANIRRKAIQSSAAEALHGIANALLRKIARRIHAEVDHDAVSTEVKSLEDSFFDFAHSISCSLVSSVTSLKSATGSRVIGEESSLTPHDRYQQIAGLIGNYVAKFPKCGHSMLQKTVYQLLYIISNVHSSSDFANPVGAQKALTELTRCIVLGIQSQIHPVSDLPLDAKTRVNTTLRYLNNAPVLSTPDILCESQNWKIIPVGPHYMISHLTKRWALSYDAYNVTLKGESEASLWHIVPHFTRGFIITTAERTPRRLAPPVDVGEKGTQLRLVSMKEDSTVWILRREGCYIRSLEPQLTNRVLTMESDKTVSLAPYIPFSNARKQDGQHADAFQIWHPVKDTVNGEMLIQFINEASRTPLRSRNIIPAVLPSVGLDDDFYFNLRPGSENGGFYIGSCSRGPVLWGYRYPKSWVCFDKSRAHIPACKLWDFVNVSTADMPITALDRCALIGPEGSDPTLVMASPKVPSSGPTSWSTFRPDDSYQRFRKLHFGDLCAFMNEATLHVLDDELRNVPLDSMTHRCWFRTEYGSLRTMFRNSVAPFQRAVLQTGDIPDTTVFYRIQIANDVQKMPTVIGIDGDGKLAVVAYDALDKNQLWRIVEWCGDRFLIHAESKRLLGVPDPDNSPIVGLVGSKYEYSKATLWTWDTSKLARNGFFKLVNNSAQVTVVGSTVQCSESSKFGVRFVQDVPHHFVLTTHHLVLKNFLASHAPVFVHAKEAPLPTNIHRFKQLAENSGKQVSDDPAAPKVYIIVRQATEPIYLNYTDVTFCLLYPPKSKEDMSRGWRFATLRFNNATHDLVSVHLPGRNQGWLHNHKRHNPLRILRQQGPLAPMKLHLYVGRDLVIRAAFPKEVTKESVLDSGKWGSCLDSGNEKVAEIVQAEMLVDDFSGSKPVRPQWVEGTKEWTAGGEGQYMPVAMLDAM